MGFIKEYFDFASEVTDAPEVFHLYLAVATLGIALGNRVYFPFGNDYIYPNFFLLILASSSSYRKSTSLRISRRIISSFNSNLIYPNEFSHEKILEVLSDNPAGVFYFSEFLTLTGLLSRDYMAGAKSLLTDLYDGGMDSYKRRLMKREYEIKRPAISIISASTLDWFLEKCKAEDFEGGFIPRFLIVVGKNKTKTYPLPPVADQGKLNRLVDYLKAYERVKGPFCLTKEARDLHREWFIKFTSKERKRFAAYFDRLQIYLLKIAMCLEIDRSMSLKISADTMKEAINMVDYIAKTFEEISTSQIAFGKLEKDRQKVYSLIMEKGEISRKELLQRSHLSSREVNTAIETLLDAELIKIEKRKGEGHKSSTWYVLREDGCQNYV